MYTNKPFVSLYVLWFHNADLAWYKQQIQSYVSFPKGRRSSTRETQIRILHVRLYVADSVRACISTYE